MYKEESSEEQFMSCDYLWDRTGEIDPEIQQLEEILDPLGYQPRPLSFPADVWPRPRPIFFPPLVVAAAIALVALAFGLWLAVIRRNSNQRLAQERPLQPPALKGVSNESQRDLTSTPRP